MPLFGKKSKLAAIVHCKCPNCHEGDLFHDPNPYHLSRITDMPKRCPKCNMSYEPEPNFFYGAMYVSYAYTVAIFVATYIIASVWGGLGMWETIGCLFGSLLLLGPMVLRLSRSTYIHLVIPFGSRGDGK